MSQFKSLLSPVLVTALGLSLGAASFGSAVAAAPSSTPVPYYTAEQALQGVYTHQLPPLAKDFVAATQQLSTATQRHCSGQSASGDLHQQWLHTLETWQTLSTPALGPIVARRSQREIDFWPARDKLIQQALQRAPKTLTDMERVGTPAKGFPAFERLLQSPSDRAMPAASCALAVLIAQGIEAEANAIQAELLNWTNKAWSDAPEDTRTAFAEWINQWLAGLERLRWAYTEKPLQIQRTSGSAASTEPAEFARAKPTSNWADRNAQWKGLQSMARMQPNQSITPPAPGQALIPIEALLRGKGQLHLADKWASALDSVSETFRTLGPYAKPNELLALASQLKLVGVLFQSEVATALDVPLGFSDADGD